MIAFILGTALGATIGVTVTLLVLQDVMFGLFPLFGLMALMLIYPHNLHT